MSRININTIYDVATNVVYVDGTLTTTYSQPQYMISKNEYVINLQLLNNGETPNYDTIVSWIAYYGNLSKTGDGELVTIPDSLINIDGDTVPEEGILTIRLDLNDAVALDVGTSAYKQHYLQLTGYDGEYQHTIALIRYRTKGIVYDPQGTLQYSSSSSSSSSSENYSESSSSSSSSSSENYSESSSSSSSFEYEICAAPFCYADMNYPTYEGTYNSVGSYAGHTLYSNGTTYLFWDVVSSGWYFGPSEGATFLGQQPPDACPVGDYSGGGVLSQGAC